MSLLTEMYEKRTPKQALGVFVRRVRKQTRYRMSVIKGKRVRALKVRSRGTSGKFKGKPTSYYNRYYNVGTKKKPNPKEFLRVG